jgi:hypothetical protein
MFWLRKVLVFWTWNYHVLSIYWLSTGGFVPSVKALDCLGLSLHLPNKIVDHVGQLVDLDVLNVNTIVQLIHYLPYSVSGIPNEVDAFIQTINQVVLLTINSPYLVVQHVDFCQELGSSAAAYLEFL